MAGIFDSVLKMFQAGGMGGGPMSPTGLPGFGGGNISRADNPIKAAAQRAVGASPWTGAQTQNPDPGMTNRAPLQAGGAGWEVFRPAIERALASEPAPQAVPATRKQGLGGFIQTMGDRAAKNMYGDQAGAMRDGVWQDVLSNVGSTMSAGGSLGEGLSAARKSGRAEVASQKSLGERKEMMTMADQLGLSPREKLVFLANPKAWAEQNAERFGVENISKGSTVRYGQDGETYTAPEYGFDQGRGYVNGPGGLRATGTLAPSYAEQTTRQNNESDADFQGRQLAAQIERWKQQGETDMINAKRPRSSGAMIIPGIPSGYELD